MAPGKERPPPEPLQVSYSYCPVIHAGNVDDRLGWIREELKRRGARLTYFRAIAGTDYYPHYTHSLDNLFRFGGCAPAIHVQAELRETRLLGMQWLNEGGGMLVRAGDDIFQMNDLRGRRIGLSRSLSAAKCDWWRATEERGIELMLALNGLSWGDVQVVDYPYADDWYGRPEMLDRVDTATDEWVARKHIRGMSFRPLETALAAGQIDACYATEPFAVAQERQGQFKLVESLSRYSDWTLQVANCPYTLTCTSDFADRHPDLVVAFLKGLIRVGRFCNANRAAAATILDRNAFYPDAATTHRWIQEIDFVPKLDAHNLKAVTMQKEWMLAHGYIAHDFDVGDWAAPEFAEAATRELAEEPFLATSGKPQAPDKGSLEEAQAAAALPASLRSLTGRES